MTRLTIVKTPKTLAFDNFLSYTEFVVFGLTKEDMMELREIVAPTTKDLIKQELLRQILRGECVLGEKLPTERDMATSMKVSRTVVNSALADLEAMGFVKIIPRQGVFVDDYSRNGNIDTLIEVMNFHEGSLDKKAFESLLQYRITAECDCAYLAAQNRTEDDIKLLEDLKNKIEITTDINEIASLKVDFHLAIYCATGNTIYPLIYNSFKKLSYNFHKLIYQTYGIEESTLYLNELIINIKAGRADSTKRTMSKLLTVRVKQIRDHYYTINPSE